MSEKTNPRVWKIKSRMRMQSVCAKELLTLLCTERRFSFEEHNKRSSGCLEVVGQAGLLLASFSKVSCFLSVGLAGAGTMNIANSQ
jgi:hypothetical protein